MTIRPASGYGTFMLHHMPRAIALLAAGAICATAVANPSLSAAAVSERPVDVLRRGAVVVRSGATAATVTWRLLQTDPDDVAFDVTRSVDGGAPILLNDAPITSSTTFRDTTADPSKTAVYTVTPRTESGASAAVGTATLTQQTAIEPALRVPIRPGGPIDYLWIGDLDGDGEYDFVIDRKTSPQTIEAYRSDGTFLWSADLGPNSVNQYRIEPGSSAIDVGHWDGVTVQDLDLDGRAEVAIRIGDGVTFGDGTVSSLGDGTRQAMAVLDGRTGALRASAPLPDDYLSDGPLAARLGVGFLDGEHPSIVAYMKNRRADLGFNLVYAAWSFDGEALTQEWEWHRSGINAPDGHNTRIIDVDRDGTDEIAEIGFVLNGDGTLRYSLADSGVVHGDRFQIGDLDPNRPGLEGYGVQQKNPSGLLEYTYDASTGELLSTRFGSAGVDVGRGVAADIDPSSPGAEFFSFSGVSSAQTGAAITASGYNPWPDLAIQWDGDLSYELLNDRRVEQWNPANPTTYSTRLPRQLATWNFGAVPGSGGKNPLIYGDILGDWREEIVFANSKYDELIVFTSDVPTNHRMVTLAQDPAYRNALTLKGYLQSNTTSFYLGE